MTRARGAIAVTSLAAFAAGVGFTVLVLKPGRDTTLPRAGAVLSSDSMGTSGRDYSTVESYSR